MPRHGERPAHQDMSVWPRHRYHHELAGSLLSLAIWPTTCGQSTLHGVGTRVLAQLDALLCIALLPCRSHAVILCPQPFKTNGLHWHACNLQKTHACMVHAQQHAACMTGCVDMRAQAQADGECSSVPGHLHTCGAAAEYKGPTHWTTTYQIELGSTSSGQIWTS